MRPRAVLIGDGLKLAVGGVGGDPPVEQREPRRSDDPVSEVARIGDRPAGEVAGLEAPVDDAGRRRADGDEHRNRSDGKELRDAHGQRPHARDFSPAAARIWRRLALTLFASVVREPDCVSAPRPRPSLSAFANVTRDSGDSSVIWPTDAQRTAPAGDHRGMAAPKCSNAKSLRQR